MAIEPPVKGDKEYLLYSFAFPYGGTNRVRFKGTLSILFRIPLKPKCKYKDYVVVTLYGDKKNLPLF